MSILELIIKLCDLGSLLSAGRFCITALTGFAMAAGICAMLGTSIVVIIIAGMILGISVAAGIIWELSSNRNRP